MEADVVLRSGRFSDRFVAYLLDTVPFAVGAAGWTWVWGGPLARPLTERSLIGIGAAWMGLAVLWQFAWNTAGGTPGKRLLGLRVATADGASPGVVRSALRALGWLLSTPLANLGFAIALFHPQTRALDDLIAGTYVVEEGSRRPSGTLLFLLAVAAVAGLLALQAWLGLTRPTPEDLAAVARARQGVEVLARIEEAYKASRGTYTDSLTDLAAASGDPALFRSAMRDVFAPTPFVLEAGNRRWRVTAAAKDRRRTLVRREGP